MADVVLKRHCKLLSFFYNYKYNDHFIIIGGDFNTDLGKVNRASDLYLIVLLLIMGYTGVINYLTVLICVRAVRDARITMVVEVCKVS